MNENRLPAGVKGAGRWTFGQKNPSDVTLNVRPDGDSLPDVATCDVDEVRRLADSNDPAVLAELTSSPRIPDDVLERLADHHQPTSVRLAAAQTGYAGTGDRAATDPNPLIRAVALSAWDLSEKHREAIGKDRSVQKVLEALSA